MLLARGIAMSDGVNRKGHCITLKGILDAYKKNWNLGLPVGLNHDRTKFVGWNYFTGIYLEPGKAYVMQEMNVPETEEEKKLINTRYQRYYNTVFCKDHIEELERLKSLLGENLSRNCKVAPISSVAYCDDNIVLKVFPELQEKMHKGLINLKDLDPVLPGVYKMGDYLLFAHRYLRRNCSLQNAFNNEFLDKFQNLIYTNLKVQIALDLDMIGLAGTEKQEAEYQFWWGPKFNDDLQSIPSGVTHIENDEYDNMFCNIRHTEFGWYMQDGRQTFECEEINERENIITNQGEMFGCRFVHSMLNPETKLPNHLDGAIRAYTDEKILNRMEISIDKSERDTDYTKLWRIDNDMSVSLWKELITHYYRDNMSIGEYFGGEDEKFEKIMLENKRKKTKISADKYIPINMEEKDGIRFSFGYRPKIQFKEEYDVDIKSEEFYIRGSEKYKVIDIETISLLKLFKRNNLKVRIPYTARIAHEDLVTNYPTICCKSAEIASIVQKSLIQMCEGYMKKSGTRMISFSLLVNNDVESIQISIAGDMNDILKVYQKLGNTFPTRDKLNEWILKLYSINNEFKNAASNPAIKDIMLWSGKMCFPRVSVPQEYLKKMEKKGSRIFVTIDEEKNREIIDEIERRNIRMAPYWNIKESRCGKCGENYMFCEHIKFLDDTMEIINGRELLGATWTNRHA